MKEMRARARGAKGDEEEHKMGSNRLRERMGRAWQAIGARGARARQGRAQGGKGAKESRTQVGKGATGQEG